MPYIIRLQSQSASKQKLFQSLQMNKQQAKQIIVLPIKMKGSVKMIH